MYLWNIQLLILMVLLYKWGLINVLSNCQGPIKDTKRTRVRLDRNVAPCRRPTTYVIGLLHECKKVCLCTKALPHSGIHIWINKVRGRGKRDRKDRGKVTDGKKGSPTKQKCIWGNKTRPTKAQLRLTKKGDEFWCSMI